MTPEKRAELTQRRKFFQRRLGATARRRRAEPAISELEKASEHFRFREFDKNESKLPEWMRPVTSHLQWEELERTSSVDFSDQTEMAGFLLSLLEERVSADQIIRVSGGSWLLEFDLSTMGRHAQAIVDTAPPELFLTSPPAAWVVQIEPWIIRWNDGQVVKT